MSPSLKPWAWRPLALLLCFALAKLVLVCLRAADGAQGMPPLAPLGLLQQDAWAALAVLAIELALLPLGGTAARWRERLLAGGYAAAALYTAINVPVARVFATPITYPMLRAAGGALSDSLVVYLTAANISSVLALLLAAAALPRALERLSPRTALALGIGLAAPPLLLGPAALRRLDAQGLHRNALLTLGSTALAHALPRGAEGAGDDGRREAAALPPEGEARDLQQLEGAARGQSVLWIVLESTAAAYLAPYGAADDPTPHLSALARRGLVFDSIYAAYPESIKGLFAELCAAYPAAHTGAERYAGAAWPCDSVAERFRAAGYRTAMFHSGWFAYLGMDGVVDRRGFDVLVDAGAVGGRYAASFGVDEAATVARVLGFLDGLPRGVPSFVMYLPIAGHHPYESPGPRDRPRPFGAASDLQRYKNDLLLGDAALGALLEGLVRRGLAARTLIVVSGDHGEAFQQHPGNFAHTLFLYEENVRVPLVIAGAGLPEAARGRAPQVGGVVDIAPTILSLAGLPASPRYQGRSLLRPEPGVARFLTDHARWLVGLRQGRWKLIHDVESSRSQLFDLQADPEERRDLASVEPERAARYRDHLLGFFARQRALALGGGRP